MSGGTAREQHPTGAQRNHTTAAAQGGCLSTAARPRPRITDASPQCGARHRTVNMCRETVLEARAGDGCTADATVGRCRLAECTPARHRSGMKRLNGPMSWARICALWGLGLWTALGCGSPAAEPHAAPAREPASAGGAQESAGRAEPSAPAPAVRPASQRTVASFSRLQRRITFTQLATDVEMAVADPQGQHMLTVANNHRVSMLTLGESGAAGGPESRPIDIPPLIWGPRAVTRSPDGTHVAMAYQAPDTEAGGGVAVVRLEDGAVVFRRDGALEPTFLSDQQAALRTGNRAMRLDLGTGALQEMGARVSHLGCLHTAALWYRPQREVLPTCPGGVFSEVAATDGSTWLVLDRQQGTQVHAIREVALGEDRAREVASSEDRPLYPSVSPNGTRYCIRPRQEGRDLILCTTFPGGELVQVMDAEADSWLPELAWIDEERLLVSRFEWGGAGVGLIDLSQGSLRRFRLQSGGSDRLFLHGVLDANRLLVREAGNDDGVVLIDLERGSYSKITVPDTEGHPYARTARGDRIWVGADVDHRSVLFEGVIGE